MHEISQQILNSKYKFKEGAPLKEYLRQRIPNFRDTCTLREVLTMLKEIIRDNLLFDENNPSMIVGDAPLETALGKKEVDVTDGGRRKGACRNDISDVRFYRSACAHAES
jgi:hypothetical protein